MIRQSGVVMQIVEAIDPELAEDFFAREAPEEEAMEWLCFKLKVQFASLLPHVTHSVEDTVPALIAALSQHYEQIGKPFHGKNTS